MTTPDFTDPAVMAKLAERTEYEADTLETIYDIGSNLFMAEGVDHVVLPLDGSPFHQIIGLATLHLGDWRPQFKQVGDPLIFVMTFKLLDMLVEWILVENGENPNYKFQEKIKLIKMQHVVFPTAIEINPDTKNRMIALYESLSPLRGTIIHDRHFKSSNGTLVVSSSKPKQPVGSPESFTESDLRNLAFLTVMLVRCLEGSWVANIYFEKQINYLLDTLATFHKLPLLGQLEPSYKRIRKYVLDEDPIDVDLEQVREAALWGRQGYDMVNDLRIVAISPDGRSHSVYLVRFEKLIESGSHLHTTRAQLERNFEPLGEDFDPVHVAKALGRAR